MKFYVIIYLSLVINQAFSKIDRNYQLMAEYVLVRISGRDLHPVDLRNGIKFSPYDLRGEEVRFLDLKESQLLEGLESLPLSEAGTRALLHLGNKAHQLGFSDSQYRVRFVHSSDAIVLEAREDIAAAIANEVADDGLFFDLQKKGSSLVRELRFEVEVVLKEIHEELLDLVDNLEKALFRIEKRDGSLKWSKNAFASLHEVDTDRLEEVLKNLERIKKLRDKFPSSIRNIDGEGQPWINLAKMTAAESNYYDQLSTFSYNLESLVKSLLKLRTGYFNTFLRESSTLEVALDRTLKKGRKGAAGIVGINQQSREDEIGLRSFINAAERLVSQFQFSRKNTLQWTLVELERLIPLHSFAMLAAWQAVERHTSFDEKFHWSFEFERFVNGYITTLIREGEWNTYCEYLLTKIARTEGVHPLLRLAAFGLLKKNTDENFAIRKTEIDRSRWYDLYRLSRERVVGSPTTYVAKKIPHIDYKRDQKISVEMALLTVEVDRIEFGFEEVTYPTRSQVKALDLPASHEGREEKSYRFVANGETPPAFIRDGNDRRRPAHKSGSGAEVVSLKARSCPLDQLDPGDKS